MRCRRVAVGLGVTVRVGSQRLTRWFASCGDAGHGDALAAGGELDAAQCDERSFGLLREGDDVVVREAGAEVARVSTRP